LAKDNIMTLRRLLGAIVSLIFLLFPGISGGDDWPTYCHDRARSGVTSERLSLPLEEAWVHRSRHAPRPAWPAPAKNDFWHRHRGLQPEVTYDRAFHVSVTDGAVFYGSSADDKIYCLDAATGRVRWAFFTDGPVRLAPTVSENKVYVGCDDGCVYCLAANDGKLLWRRRISPDDRRIPGNERMISVWPVRTGVILDGGVVYCCAGLFPREGVYVCALNAEDGAALWMKETDRASPQGYLLASRTRLFVPTGRTAPAIFDRAEGRGKYLGEFSVQGGAFALVSDDILVSGPGRTTGSVDVADTKTRERIATFNGLDMIVHRGAAYLHSKTSIAALDRVRYLKLARESNALAKHKDELEKRLASAKKEGRTEQVKALGGELFETKQRLGVLSGEMSECFTWRRPCSYPYSLILAGDELFAGGDDGIAALRTADGEQLWTTAVEGRAYGLAVAGGRLFVSTDTGAIHCFIPKGAEPSADFGFPISDFGTGARGAGLRQALSRGGVRNLQSAIRNPQSAGADFQSRQFLLPQALPFRVAPHVRHIAMGEVAISWETEEPGPGALEYGESPELGKRIEAPADAAAHRVRLTGLNPDTDYYFRVTSRDAQGARRASRLVTFDSSSDLSPSVRPRRGGVSPYPEDELTALYARAAKHIVALSGVRKGYCLDLGCGKGRLAYEMAKLTDLRIVGVEEDAEKVAAARRALDKAGIYGVRVSVHQGSLSRLPYTSRLVNLIVSDKSLVSGKLPGRKEEVFRILRPYGGFVCFGQPEGEAMAAGKLTRSEIGRWLAGERDGEWEVKKDEGHWVIARRGRPPGTGEWSHLYADAGNSACSGDELRAPTQVQWFGRPGPRNMIDRHHRALGPLAKDGRVFVQGNNRVLALDAYNGTLLWDAGIPNSRRVAAARDCGHLVITSDYVYLAAGEKCVGLDVATGELSLSFDTPQLGETTGRYWGYVASVDDLLFGSAEKKGASRTGHSRSAILGGTYYDNKPIASSDCLFCLDRHTGKRLWIYRREGGSVIINSAIAVGDGHIYFIESRNPEALGDSDGRVTLEVLVGKGNTYLVKLDQRSGEKLWERHVELSTIRHVLFVSYARSTVVVVGSRNDAGHPRYDLRAFHAGDGSLMWSNHYVRTDKPTNGDHGEQDQHPVIIGDTVYSRPYAYDLRTGEKKSFNLDRGGHGCGGLTASAFYLYGRGGNPLMYPLSKRGRTNIPLTRVSRPGCWVNIIPAGGLVLIPEGSSGCTCGYPLQTSLALAPREPRALSATAAIAP